MRKKLPIDVRPQAENKARITVSLPFRISSADIGPTHELMEDGAILHSSVSPPRRKLAAARWFLDQFRRCIQNEGAALMFLEAFVTALRSATFALQKLCSDKPGFETWYQNKQEQMRSDQHLRWLVNLRNAAEKEGLVLAEYGPHAIVRINRDGIASAVLGEPSFNLVGIETEQFLPSLEATIEKIHSIIEEAHERFLKEYGRKQISYLVEYIREKPDGSWERFDIE